MIKLDSEQQIDLTVLDVKDIVDQSVLQSFLENYALSVGLAVVVADRNGEKIVDGCMSRDASIGSSAVINRIVDTVSNTLRTYSEITQTDSHIFAVPVIVKDQVLGAVICEDVNAGDNNIDAAITVVEIFVSSIVEAGYNRVSVESLASQLAENFIQVSKTLEELALSAQNITESLGEDISKVESVTSEISDITGSINKLADRTMMLGLNASIEAARLGNDGRGFAVVATQIRELSASSRKTSEDIKKLNDQINEYVVSTISNSRESLKTTEDQSAAMQELSATIQTMVAVAQSLKEMYM